MIVDLAPDAGVTVKKRRLGRADAVDPEADAPRFAIAVRGDAPGDYAVQLHVRFWLCGTQDLPADRRRAASPPSRSAHRPSRTTRASTRRPRPRWMPRRVRRRETNETRPHPKSCSATPRS